VPQRHFQHRETLLFSERCKLIDKQRIGKSVSRDVELFPYCRGDIPVQRDCSDHISQVMDAHRANFAGFRVMKYEIAKSCVGFQKIGGRLEHCLSHLSVSKASPSTRLAIPSDPGRLHLCMLTHIQHEENDRHRATWSIMLDHGPETRFERFIRVRNAPALLRIQKIERDDVNSACCNIQR